MSGKHVISLDLSISKLARTEPKKSQKRNKEMTDSNGWCCYRFKEECFAVAKEKQDSLLS